MNRVKHVSRAHAELREHQDQIRGMNQTDRDHRRAHGVYLEKKAMGRIERGRKYRLMRTVSSSTVKAQEAFQKLSQAMNVTGKSMHELAEVIGDDSPFKKMGLTVVQDNSEEF